MQNRLMAKAAQTGMAMDNFNLLSNHDIPENREKGEDGREGGGAVDDEEGDVVDFEAVGEVADPGAPFVLVCYDDDFVAPVDELCA
jgi:hypothetical protein